MTRAVSMPIVGSVCPAPEGMYGKLPYVFVAMVAVHLALVFTARRDHSALPAFTEPGQV